MEIVTKTKTKFQDLYF